MIPRLVSSLVLIPPVLAAIWFGSPYFHLLLVIGGLAAVSECCLIAADGRAERLGYAAVCLLVAVVALYSAGHFFWAWSVIGFGAVGLTVFGLVPTGGRSAWPAIGFVYVGTACIALMELRGDGDEGRETIVWLFFVVWATDIGAYGFGRGIGGPRLAPVISPNKTWAGLIGGATSAAVVATILLAVTAVERDIIGVIVFSAVVAVVSQIGDLLESWYKRRFGVKDSGSLIPGHGGILDRIDGLLLAAPCVALVFWLSEGGISPWK